MKELTMAPKKAENRKKGVLVYWGVLNQSKQCAPRHYTREEWNYNVVINILIDGTSHTYKWFGLITFYCYDVNINKGLTGTMTILSYNYEVF